MLAGLLVTDGQRTRAGGSWSYNTVSRQLADGVQRLAISLGWRAAISEDEIKSGPYYRVRLSLKRETYIQRPEVVPYTGKVYCVEVENHLVVTRRNGRPIVTGNSMFEKYIEKCDKRIRRAFRIPSQFMGMSEDFTFATAVSSAMVAEAQVFACERHEFDEIINLTIMQELPNGDQFLYRSKTLSLRDAESQLKGLDMIADELPLKMFVERVAETIGMPDLTLTDEEVFLAEERRDERRRLGDARVSRLPSTVAEGSSHEDDEDSNPTARRAARDGTVQKAEGLTGVVSMAQEMADILIVGLSLPEQAKEFLRLKDKIKTLDDGQREHFRALLTAFLLPAKEHDPEGAEELTALAFDVTARRVEG